jgi:ribosomal protein S12 methylthiotransferase
MVERGVKEINLVAQDTTWYGHDLNPSCTLEGLLEKLLTISGLKWLRILYAHPYHVTERLLDLIDTEEALCPYLDIPIQHVNPDILRAMGRPSGTEPIPQLIERIRHRSRHIALRKNTTQIKTYSPQNNSNGGFSRRNRETIQRAP